jgi:hypothetical protein
VVWYHIKPFGDNEIYENKKNLVLTPGSTKLLPRGVHLKSLPIALQAMPTLNSLGHFLSGEARAIFKTLFGQGQVRNTVLYLNLYIYLYLLKLTSWQLDLRGK